MAGFERARGTIILTLPAYHQIDVGRIFRKLVAALARGHGRSASAGRATAACWIACGAAHFHGLVELLTGVRLQDLGCGARAMQRQVLEEIDPVRRPASLPAPCWPLARVSASSKLTCVSRPAIASRRMYRPREYAHLVLDLFTVFFLMRFTKKPLRFFGMLGAASFGVGVAHCCCMLIVQRLLFDERSRIGRRCCCPRCWWCWVCSCSPSDCWAS